MLKDHAMAVIRRALVSGAVQPGEIFSATALAAQLEVSNSPVRDALLELVHGGIMEVVPNRGFRVVQLDDHDLAEVYQLRELIEVPAVAQLAERGIPEDAATALTQAAERCVAAAEQSDLPAFLDGDRAFHLGLLELLGNQRLVLMVDRLRDQTRIQGMRRLVAQGSLAASAAEHHDLLLAVVEHRVPDAESIMRHHMAHGSTPPNPPVFKEPTRG
ncbi:GntR family transcriptional regulator [Quadrisphaera granulorum]|uniref:GntR family transcriptional regulator n=1 Tax=Quadrisphaera granulorum TaxID=317664 RepID=UPI0014733B28|nr:GntR family transcriptional regulator [Quadrisphaera granulorum]